jgi:hypothetical protein
VPRHIVNICFSQPNWLREREVFLTYVDQTTDKVLVLIPRWRGYEIWPWARWAVTYGLDARFSIRPMYEDQIGALSATLGALNTEYETTAWWERLRVNMSARRTAIVVQFLIFAGMRTDDFKHPEDLYAALATNGKNALRML